MIKLFKIVAVLFALLLLGSLLLAGTVIKILIEREGSRALQAPLYIEHASLDLLPTALTLRGVQIAESEHNGRDISVDSITLTPALSDLFTQRLIAATIEIHGLHLALPTLPSADTSTTDSTSIHAALQRARLAASRPLSAEYTDVSLAGAALAAKFKPLLNQIAGLLRAALPTGSRASSAWPMLARHVNVDGVIDYGGNSFPFSGTLENITPQPKLFDVETHFDLHSTNGERTKFNADGNWDGRKLPRAALHVDLTDLPLTQWPLSADSDLRVTIARALVNVRAQLAVTGDQLDVIANTQFRQAQIDITGADDEIARTLATIWRNTDAFDIDIQASGSLDNLNVKSHSSLDAPLAAALRQLPPPAAFPATPVTNSP